MFEYIQEKWGDGGVLGADRLAGVWPVIDPGWILYASDDSPDSLTEARDYIAANQLTAEDVKLIRKDNAIMVIAKRRIWE